MQMNSGPDYENETYDESTHFGIAVNLPDSRGGRIGRCWQKGRFYESGLLNHIYELSLTGTYVDVGMNAGNHSLFFSKVCPSRQVLAFEPFAAHIDRAEVLLKKNDVRNKVNIFNVALSDSRGELDLKIGSWKTRALSMRLDAVAPADVSLIKIDVEGAELAVIRGASESISKSKPYLFVELWDENFDEGVETISAMGYELGRRFKTPTYEFIPTS